MVRFRVVFVIWAWLAFSKLAFSFFFLAIRQAIETEPSQLWPFAPVRTPGAAACVRTENM